MKRGSSVCKGLEVRYGVCQWKNECLEGDGKVNLSIQDEVGDDLGVTGLGGEDWKIWACPSLAGATDGSLLNIWGAYPSAEQSYVPW